MDSLAADLTAPMATESPAERATAQVWLGGNRLETRTTPLPELSAGEVLVGVRLATVCGSDRHTVAGRRSSPVPGILGHEAVGEVVAVGTGGAIDVDGSPVRVGDRVVWSVAVSCAECDRCRAGRRAKCRSVRKIGHERYAAPWWLSGCYASHVHLPAGADLVRVPAAVPDVVAAPAGCATATVVAAVEAAGSLVGRRVLVHGAGMLGLTATALAGELGAASVTVVDPDPKRRESAVAMGASSTADVDKRLAEDGHDVALEFSGSATAIAAGLEALDIGGTQVLVGSVAPGPAVPVDPERIVRRWLTMTGVHNYEPVHLARAVALLARTPGLPWADVVGDPRPLEAVGELLDPGAETANGAFARMSVRP